MLGWSPAGAQDYPSKTITIVIPFASGSGTDQIARAYAQAITQLYKVPVVVDAKPGASGFIAAQYVAKAPNDGYTVLYTTNTTHAANEHFFKKIPYDPVKDFSPVALLSKGHMALVVPPNSPFKTVADIVAEAKKRPGHINFGSGSSSSRMASEMFKQLAGVQMVNVPYKSNPLVITDLMGGQLDFMFTDAATGVPQITGGKLRALAVSGTHRLAALAQVPTMEEAGIKGYDMSYWNAVYLPAGAPPAVVKKLNDMLAKANAHPSVQAFMASTSGEMSFTNPEGLATFQATESQRWGRVVRAAGIEPE
jgi:tripartite-type tricarboxylate transporter receptor subunit TctC